MSEASMRFRRGADYGINMERALIGGGTSKRDMRTRDVQVLKRTEISDTSPVGISNERVNGLLGTLLTSEEMMDLLQSIG